MMTAAFITIRQPTLFYESIGRQKEYTPGNKALCQDMDVKQSHKDDRFLMGFNAVINIYHGDQLTHSCVLWLSHTITPLNNFSKQLAAFPHGL